MSADVALMERMAELADYPEQWLIEAFPWGEAGSVLEAERPRAWQLELFQEVGERIRANAFNGFDPVEPVQAAVSSGHGTGKSATSAQIIMFLMTTRPMSKGTVTANTVGQLRTKTWAEVKKWRDLCIAGHWFEYRNSHANMSLKHIVFPEQWRCDAFTAREENSEAFAGQHAKGASSFYVVDEASAVPDKIFEVSDGGLVHGEPMRFLFGNPTRSTGRFVGAVWGRQRHRYIRRVLDSRDVEGTNKEYLQGICDDWGEDSDYARVRVKGERPRMASMQFISTELAQSARVRDAAAGLADPLICFVDVARFGDDRTVIGFRRGRNARVFPWKTFRNIDLMTLANVIAEIAKGSPYTNGQRPDAIVVDGGGLGAGVVDRLRQLQVDVFDYQGGAASPEPKCLNMRAACWYRMREWLAYGAIPDDEDLETDLTGIEYAFGVGKQDGKIKMESKKDMKARNLASPDNADALSISFAFPVLAAGDSVMETGSAHVEYNPLED